jgi:membrane protein
VGLPLAVVYKFSDDQGSCLGVTRAAQHALDTVWAVSRTARPDTLRAWTRGLALLLLGAIFAAIAWQALQELGTYYLAHELKGTTKHLWPRSLLTPFTDNVDLTRADKSAYTSYAQAEQHKAFETIEVTFPPPSTHHDQPHK